MSRPTNNTNNHADNNLSPQLSDRVEELPSMVQTAGAQNMRAELDQNKPDPGAGSKKHTPVLLVVLLIILAAAMVVLVNEQSIIDWWRLRNYHPPQAVLQLANEDTMTSYTRHLFYLNKPRILNTVATFRQYCPENENTIVLGCYHPDQNGIFIYNVPDPTLAGVQQVTAAHEVLHAIYARLSTKQRDYVDGLLENYYRHDLHDPTVLAEIKLYQQTEPHSVMDEMNSTFGTEIANLPVGLEKYYSQYFTNRAAIVHYESQYESELTSRLTTITADDVQLSKMQASINSLESTLNSESTHLSSEHAALEQLLNSGQYTSYNAQVDSYNAQVTSYNAEITTLQAQINTYNSLIATRNSVANQLTTLDKALDTRLTKQSTQS